MQLHHRWHDIRVDLECDLGLLSPSDPACADTYWRRVVGNYYAVDGSIVQFPEGGGGDAISHGGAGSTQAHEDEIKRRIAVATAPPPKEYSSVEVAEAGGVAEMEIHPWPPVMPHDPRKDDWRCVGRLAERDALTPEAIVKRS